MEIIEKLRELGLNEDLIAKAKEHVDANGGQLPDWIKDHAGGVLDMIPAGFGDRLGDMLGVETAADRSAAESTEHTS